MASFCERLIALEDAIANQTDLDEQTLTLSGTDLTISNGNTVSLAALLDDTDISAITTTLVGTILTTSVTEDGMTFSDVVNLATLDTDDQTLSTTVDPVTGATTSITIANGNTIPIVHPDGGCEDWEGTRAQLIALRNASSLKPGCIYRVTGYSRGCLTAEYIAIEATDVNQLSFDAEVKVAIDTLAWEGRYDIDTNRVVELHDNRGNQAKGGVGVEVDNFPWTDTNWTDVQVIDAQVLVDCTNDVTVSSVRFLTDSYTDLRGTTGSIVNSTFENDSDVRRGGTTGLDVDDSNFSRADIDGANATNVRYLAVDFTANGTDSYNNHTGGIQRSYVNIDGGYVYVTGGGLNRLYQFDMSQRSTIRQISGSMDMYYGSINSYAEIRNEAGSALFQSYYSDYDSRGYIRNYNTNRVRHYSVKAMSRGEINHRDAALQNFYYTTAQDYGRIISQGTTTAVYATKVGTQSIFTVNGGNHYRNRIDGLAYITTAFNTRSVIVDGRFTQTLTAANTNRGRNYNYNTLV